MRSLRLSMSGVCVATLAACGAVPTATNLEASRILADARTPAVALTQRHRRTLPNGTAVYTPRLIGVRTANGLQTFPASAKVVRGADRLTVTVQGTRSTFPVQATVEDVTGSVEYYVYPSQPIPSSLRGMAPSAIVRNGT